MKPPHWPSHSGAGVADSSKTRKPPRQAKAAEKAPRIIRRWSGERGLSVPLPSYPEPVIDIRAPHPMPRHPEMLRAWGHGPLLNDDCRHRRHRIGNPTAFLPNPLISIPTPIAIHPMPSWRWRSTPLFNNHTWHRALLNMSNHRSMRSLWSHHTTCHN